MNEYLFKNRAIHFGYLYNHAIRLVRNYANVLPARKYNEVLRSVYNLGTYAQRAFNYMNKYQIHTAEDIAVYRHELKTARLINDSYSLLAHHNRLHLGDVDRDRFIHLLHNKSHKSVRNLARAHVQDEQRRQTAFPYHDTQNNSNNYSSDFGRPQQNDDYNPFDRPPSSAYNPFANKEPKPTTSSADTTKSATSQAKHSKSVSLSASRVASASDSDAQVRLQRDRRIASNQHLNYSDYNGNLDDPVHTLRQQVDSNKDPEEPSDNSDDFSDNAPQPSDHSDSNDSTNNASDQINPFKSDSQDDTSNNDDIPSDDTSEKQTGDDSEQQPQSYGGSHEMNLNQNITGKTSEVGTGTVNPSASDNIGNKDDSESSSNDSEDDKSSDSQSSETSGTNESSSKDEAQPSDQSSDHGSDDKGSDHASDDSDTSSDKTDDKHSASDNKSSNSGSGIPPLDVK